MKRLIFLLSITVCFALSSEAYAQRCYPGMRGLQITGGMVDGFYPFSDDNRAFHAGIAISTYTKRSNKWVFGAEYLQKEIDYKKMTIPIAQFTGEGGYYYKFLSDRRRFFLCFFGVSGMAGYETVNWGDSKLFDGSVINNEDRFIYGGAISLELETYLTDRLVFLISGRQRVLWGTTTGHFHSQIGIGVKIIIN